jgi:GT2 family glycosyltransferase
MINFAVVEKSLSIIIVSYNVSDLLKQCIISIKQFLGCKYEIIVVDNASKDQTLEMLASEFPDVICIYNSENVGFSAANNQGLKIAKGENILFLNPDTEFCNGSFNQFIRSFIESKEAKLISGPGLLNSDGSFQQSTWNFPNFLFHLSELFFLHSFLSKGVNKITISQLMYNGFVSGAALLIKRENAIALGGFDENLFWMDDADLCYRNIKSGGMIQYFSDAKIVHHSGQSGKKNYKVQISNQIISKLKFYRKHSQYLNYFFSLFIFFIHIVSRISIFSILTPINKVFFEKFKAYLFSFRKFFQYLIFGNNSVT